MKGAWLVLLLCQGVFAGPQWVSITIPGLFEIYGCEYTTSYPRTGYRIGATLDECKQSCLTGVSLTEGNNSGCMAVEWHQTTGWCNFYTNLCNTSVPTSQEGIILYNTRARPFYKFYVNAATYYPVTCTIPRSQVGAVKCIEDGSACFSVFDGNASVGEHYKLAENSTILTGLNPNCSSFPNPLFGSTALNPCDVLGCVRNGSSGGYQAYYYGAAPVPTTAAPTLSLAPTSPTTRVPTSPAPTGTTFPLWARVTIPGLFEDYGCEFTTNFSRTGYRINITLNECKQACLTGTSLTEGTNLGCRGIEWHNRTGWCNLYTELCNSSVTPTTASIDLYDGRPRPFYRYYGDPNNFYYITCILPLAAHLWLPTARPGTRGSNRGGRVAVQWEHELERAVTITAVAVAAVIITIISSGVTSGGVSFGAVANLLVHSSCDVEQRRQNDDHGRRRRRSRGGRRSSARRYAPRGGWHRWNACDLNMIIFSVCLSVSVSLSLCLSLSLSFSLFSFLSSLLSLLSSLSSLSLCVYVCGLCVVACVSCVCCMVTTFKWQCCVLHMFCCHVRVQFASCCCGEQKTSPFSKLYLQIVRSLHKGTWIDFYTD